MKNKKQDKQLGKLLFEVYDNQQDCDLTKVLEYIEKVKKALHIHTQSEQYFCSKEQIGQRCNEQCLGCFQFENKD